MWEIDQHHAEGFYAKLSERVLPCFYGDREHFMTIMRYAITLNGAFFNTQRMVWQYLHNAYHMHEPVSPGVVPNSANISLT